MSHIFRPWQIRAKNFYNKITPLMDKTEEIYDISGQRLPRYQSIIKVNQAYDIDAVGRKPKVWKWQLQYAEDTDWVILELDYTVPQSLKVTVNGKQVTPNIVKSDRPQR